MENLNVVNDTQAPVVEAPSEPATGGGGSEQPQDAELTGRGQSAEDNRKFRKLRLKIGEYEKQIESLEGRLKEFEGEDFAALKAQNQQLYERYADFKAQSDLKEIQRIDPSVKGLGDLGENFVRLIQNGIDAKTAFLAVRGQGMGGFKPEVPALGKLESTGGAGSEYFTSAQLDRLTEKDLNDPQIFKKAMKSLSKL